MKGDDVPQNDPLPKHINILEVKVYKKKPKTSRDKTTKAPFTKNKKYQKELKKLLEAEE